MYGRGGVQRERGERRERGGEREKERDTPALLFSGSLLTCL